MIFATGHNNKDMSLLAPGLLNCGAPAPCKETDLPDITIQLGLRPGQLRILPSCFRQGFPFRGPAIQAGHLVRLSVIVSSAGGGEDKRRTAEFSLPFGLPGALAIRLT